MALRKFAAYLDDLQTITIVMPKRFEQENLAFSIENVTGCSKLIYHDVAEESELADDRIYRLRLQEPIDLEAHYAVYDHDRNGTPLQYRYVVRTKSFDQHFEYDGDDLGASYTPVGTTFKLWAPISEQVLLLLGEESYAMERGAKGVWSVTVSGDQEGEPYHYLHKVNGIWQQVHDPYAISSEVNSGRSFVVDTSKFLPVTRTSQQLPPDQAIIYEMSVRDFTSQAEAGFDHAGQFLGLTESRELDGQAIGLDYLTSLGVTHVQLMPLFDFGSVDEANPRLLYNWGYDPVQYNVPEGSFASNPYDPYTRILELQTAIKAYHDANISVVMDVVYNHVYDIDTYAFEKIVPGYCYRVNDKQEKTNGTWCGNDIASERRMIRRYIKHSVRHWLNVIGVDGFRFDLMGILDKQTLNELTTELKAIYPNAYIYGEGWDMPTGLHHDMLAHQFNARSMSNIGFFNDRFRDTFKKSLVDPQKLLEYDMRQKIEDSLTGTLGTNVAGGNGRFLDSSQSLNYIECHDNATFFDYIRMENPSISVDNQRDIARFALQLILVSQGVAFLHSGQEFFRTKKHLDNTYNSPDSINRLDWTRAVTYKDDVAFIKQLIAFRKSHPHFALLSKKTIQAQVEIYWIHNHFLNYSIQDESEELQILINFGKEDATYPLDKPATLLVAYPFVGEKKITGNVTVPHQSLIILKND